MCQIFNVTGRVQGVFFRDSTREVAESLNIAGHAVNLPNGSVEVRACGSENDIAHLGQWLRKGPRLASVDDVVRKNVDCSSPVGFTVG